MRRMYSDMVTSDEQLVKSYEDPDDLVRVLSNSGLLTPDSFPRLKTHDRIAPEVRGIVDRIVDSEGFLERILPFSGSSIPGVYFVEDIRHGITEALTKGQIRIVVNQAEENFMDPAAFLFMCASYAADKYKANGDIRITEYCGEVQRTG